MTTPPICSVHGCDSRAAGAFDVSRNKGPAIEYRVCALHHTELEEGELFALSKDREELLLGDDAPVELLTARGHTDVSGSTVEFVFGRKGGQSLSVHARVTPERAQMLIDTLEWITEDEDATPL